METGFWSSIFSMSQFSVFFWIFVFGTGFAFLTFIFGELLDGVDDIFQGAFEFLHLDSIFDIDDIGVGPSIFSTRAISVFVIVFGGAGLLATVQGVNPLFSSVIGAGSGLVIASIFLLIFRWVHSQQSSSIMSNASLVGKKGIIKTAIPAGGLGEVIVDNAGLRITRTAQSYDGNEISNNKGVTVKEVRGNTVIVATE